MWEQQVTKFESMKDPEGNAQVMTNTMKMAAFVSMLPEQLEQHIQLNSARLTTYELMREEVSEFLDNLRGTEDSRD